MKNYNEMANDVIRRIGEHETKQRNRKKIIIPICCFCLLALLGITLWQGDFFNSTPPITLDDSTIIGEKDYVDDKDGSGDNNSATSESSNTKNDNVAIDVIGMVKYGGANYVQCSTTTKAYTPDKYLGQAYDFEGTYQIGFEGIVGGLYITKEDPDVLMVELNNSEYTDYVILIKEEN